jgi:hypothetical protein
MGGPGQLPIIAVDSGVERLARLPFRPVAAIAAVNLEPVLDAVTAHLAGR